MIPSEDDLKNTKTLFASEGSMLPSKTEISLAKKAKFDLYTITSLSFMELSAFLGLKPNLFAVAKHDLSNPDEEIT